MDEKIDMEKLKNVLCSARIVFIGNPTNFRVDKIMLFFHALSLSSAASNKRILHVYISYEKWECMAAMALLHSW